MALPWLYWFLVVILSEAAREVNCLKVNLQRESLHNALQKMNEVDFTRFLHSVTSLEELAQVMDPLEHTGSTRSFAEEYNLRWYYEQVGCVKSSVLTVKRVSELVLMDEHRAALSKPAKPLLPTLLGPSCLARWPPFWENANAQCSDTAVNAVSDNLFYRILAQSSESPLTAMSWVDSKGFELFKNFAKDSSDRWFQVLDHALQTVSDIDMFMIPFIKRMKARKDYIQPGRHSLLVTAPIFEACVTVKNVHSGRSQIENHCTARLDMMIADFSEHQPSAPIKLLKALGLCKPGSRKTSSCLLIRKPWGEIGAVELLFRYAITLAYISHWIDNCTELKSETKEIYQKRIIENQGLMTQACKSLSQTDKRCEAMHSIIRKASARKRGLVQFEIVWRALQDAQAHSVLDPKSPELYGLSLARSIAYISSVAEDMENKGWIFSENWGKSQPSMDISIYQEALASKHAKTASETLYTQFMMHDDCNANFQLLIEAQPTLGTDYWQKLFLKQLYEDPVFSLRSLLLAGLSHQVRQMLFMRAKNRLVFSESLNLTPSFDLTFDKYRSPYQTVLEDTLTSLLNNQLMYVPLRVLGSTDGFFQWPKQVGSIEYLMKTFWADIGEPRICLFETGTFKALPSPMRTARATGSQSTAPAKADRYGSFEMPLSCLPNESNEDDANEDMCIGEEGMDVNEEDEEDTSSNDSDEEGEDEDEDEEDTDIDDSDEKASSSEASLDVKIPLPWIHPSVWLALGRHLCVCAAQGIKQSSWQLPPALIDIVFELDPDTEMPRIFGSAPLKADWFFANIKSLPDVLMLDDRFKSLCGFPFFTNQTFSEFYKDWTLEMSLRMTAFNFLPELDQIITAAEKLLQQSKSEKKLIRATNLMRNMLNNALQRDDEADYFWSPPQCRDILFTGARLPVRDALRLNLGCTSLFKCRQDESTSATSNLTHLQAFRYWARVLLIVGLQHFWLGLRPLFTYFTAAEVRAMIFS